MEKTLENTLEEQNVEHCRLLAKHAVNIMDEWYVPAQVTLDIVSGRITE